MPTLSDDERRTLATAAGRLRRAVHCVELACEKQGASFPAALTEWPTQPRRGGWARGRENDQVEDEQLRTVVAAGIPVVRNLRERGADDPLVRLAHHAFASAAEQYLRTSNTLHDVRTQDRVGVDVAAELIRCTDELVKDIERSDALQRSMPQVRLVPPGVVAAAHLLRDDLEMRGPDEAQPTLAAQLVRDLEGTLGLLAPHAGSLPASIVEDAREARSALAAWDRTTGSFRDVDALWLADDTTPGASAAALDDVAELQTAEQAFTSRVDEVVDRYVAHMDEPASPLRDRLREFVRETIELRGGVMLPLEPAARDDAVRAHAVRIAWGFEHLTGDCFDSSDLRDHDLGRSLRRAGDAAARYVAASESVADRARCALGPHAPTFGEAIDRARDAWTEARRVLAGRGIGEIAVAELTATGHDITESRAEYVARPRVAGADLVMGSHERRACQSVRWLLCGDAATQLALSSDGRAALDGLRGALRMLESATGARRSLPEVPVAQQVRWLADVGQARAEQGPERLGTIIARLRTGHTAARDVRAHRGRGPAASW
jgi:hypothetical protein